MRINQGAERIWTASVETPPDARAWDPTGRQAPAGAVELERPGSVVLEKHD
jgi:hypothetical protein